MPSSPKSRILLAALVVAGIVGIALTWSANLPLSPSHSYSSVTVTGQVIGKVYTPGSVVGNVTAVLFVPSNSTAQGNVHPATLNPDGSYSVTLVNGRGYFVSIYVVNPNNDEDNGFCSGQSLQLTNPQQESYKFDIRPFNCGQLSDFSG